VKILRIGSYPTETKGGMGYHAYKISNNLDFECLYVTPYYSDNILKSNANIKIKLLRFFNSPRPRNPSFKQKIFHLFKRLYFILEFSSKSTMYIFKYKPDIIHVHSPMFSMVSFIGWVMGKKIYITFHGEDFYKVENNPFYSLTAFMYKDVFVLSPHMKSYLDTVHNSKNVHIVFNGVDQEIFKDKDEKRNKDFIAVGYLKKVKGYDFLLRAFKIFCDEHNFSGKLKIAGSGDELGNLKELSVSLGLEERVVFLGELDNESLVNLYNQNEFFVLSSLSEGFPKVMLEAMSCGNIVISTDVGSVGNILEDYPYVCMPSNEKDLALKMSNCFLADNRDQKIYLSNRVQDFSWSYSANTYKEVYEKN